MWHKKGIKLRLTQRNNNTIPSWAGVNRFETNQHLIWWAVRLISIPPESQYILGQIWFIKFYLFICLLGWFDS